MQQTCLNLCLLFQVNSSILLQLKPKFSANPNMTVYTPTELYVRGLSSNIPCNIVNNRKRKEVELVFFYLFVMSEWLN